MKYFSPRTLVIGLGAVVAAMAPAVPAAAGGGGCHTTLFSDAAATNVDLKDICMNPNVVRVEKGTTVTFRNAESMAIDHTVTGVSGSFGSYDNLAPGATVAFRFDKQGVFPYFCAFHPGMVGAVVVGGGGREAGTTGALITRVKPTALHVTTPSTSVPWLPLGLLGGVLLLLAFAAGRRVRAGRS